MKKLFLLVGMLLTMSLEALAEADPNFHIYLCFGQSNMEGNAQWEAIDNKYVDPRFQMLATTDFDNPKRKLGEWYTAFCPIVSPTGRLGMADYFGRTMVAAMPTDVKVGVVAVAMGGSPIEMFDKDKFAQKLKDNPNEWWAQLAKNYYGGNPYKRLTDMAKKAQEVGVIKGILLHQGCSNCGDPNWPTMVKKIYNDMLADLGLNAADVPLFAGETEREDMGGGCSYHNTVVAKLPKVIPTAHVVSSEGIPGNGTDAWHFSAAGYRIFGKRYAYEALKVMNAETRMNAEYTMPDNLKGFFTPKRFETDFTVKPNTTFKLKLACTFADNHTEDLTSEAVFGVSSAGDDISISNGRIRTGADGSHYVISATYTDFIGTEHQVNINIEVSGTTRFTPISKIEDGATFAIVNEEEGKAFYGSDNQNLAYDVFEKAFVDSNSGYLFRAESLAKSGDSSLKDYYLLRLIKPDGSEYSIWGSPGYLNSQPSTGWCSFILGITGTVESPHKNGQDIDNGAVWDIKYVDGLGYTLKNIATGLYLKDAAPAKYEEPAYFMLATLGSTAVEAVKAERLADSVVYDLQGRRIGHSRDSFRFLRTGMYIIGGKKYIVK